MRYRIGSFNLKNFGAYANFETADAPRRDFEKIAQIIREESLDVVAFQEILSEGKGLRRLLEQIHKHALSSMGFLHGFAAGIKRPCKMWKRYARRGIRLYLG